MASTNTTNLMLNGLGLDTQQFSDMFKGGLDKLTGENEDGIEKNEIGEDPEVIAARLEQEERRKEKHRKMEEEREKMRQNIRAKYNIKKKEQQPPGSQFVEGRIGGPKKLPEQVEQVEENSLLWQLGIAESLGKAKTAVTGAIVIVKGYLPFGSFTK